MTKRIAFFVSDGTGITAEALGHSLLSQFSHLEFENLVVPYVDTVEKAKQLVEKINKVEIDTGYKAILVDTIVDNDVRDTMASANAFKIDVYGAFLCQLEQELDVKSDHSVGKSHLGGDDRNYLSRIDAVNFALDNDDGARIQNYNEADVILVGVSRSGKTPTCLYMALQFGIKAANYPVTEEDLTVGGIPKALKPFTQKLFGLTIDPERLAAIRNERRANSRYSSLRQCYLEIDEVELMFQQYKIPYLSTTDLSVEEISTRIMMKAGIKRTCA